MKRSNFLAAANAALQEEMRHDERVFVIGLDVTSNLFGSTQGLVDEFGKMRVRDTPISEAGFTGIAAGAALVGMRPVVSFMMAPFMYMAFDQIVNTIAKSRYLYGGQAKLPIVMMASMSYGPAASLAAQHSDRPYGIYAHIPGLKIIIPTNAYDMKGLLKSAIRDDNPVLVFQDNALWSRASEIPEEEYFIPLGKANVVRSGNDVTVVAIGACVPMALAAADALGKDDISVEIIDPRTISPMDWPAILQSVRKTGRLVIAEVDWRTCGVASEIAATAATECFDNLLAPVRIVATPDVHIPFSPALESGLYPTKDKIVAAVRQTLR